MRLPANVQTGTLPLHLHQEEIIGLQDQRIESSGTDNAIYRLGEDMAVRLPRIAGGTGTIETELRWLPKLAPLLPVAISQPLAKGSPGQAIPGTGRCTGGWTARA